MKDLLLYIARNLVDDPEAVTVTETVSGNQELTLELRVAPDDMGKVIGRQGRIAKEIRTVVRSRAQREGVKVSVDISLNRPRFSSCLSKNGVFLLSNLLLSLDFMDSTAGAALPKTSKNATLIFLSRIAF